MTTQITSTDSKLLFMALGANGLFSVISGAAMIVAPATIASFLGIDLVGTISDLGIMLVLFGAALLYYFKRKRVRKLDAVVVSLLDLGWVLGSATIIMQAPDMFSTAGVVAVVAVALVVLAFFEMQAVALWRVSKAA